MLEAAWAVVEAMWAARLAEIVLSEDMRALASVSIAESTATRTLSRSCLAAVPTRSGRAETWAMSLVCGTVLLVGRIGICYLLVSISFKLT